VHVTVVRLVWLLAAVMTGVGFIAYPIAWIVMPDEPEVRPLPMAHQVTNP
jgi:phage shock protein PspC (stress-responsive transcriptional regulator)